MCAKRGLISLIVFFVVQQLIYWHSKLNTFMFCSVVPDFQLYIILGGVSQIANPVDIHIILPATSAQRPKVNGIQ
jgi:hypothetical protein